jgi:hypothetical protein
MKLSKSSLVQNSRVATDIYNYIKKNKHSELPPIYKDWIDEAFQDCEYAIVDVKEERVSPLYRLTIIPYVLFIVLIVLVVWPMKWLVTGTRYFKYNSKFYRFIEGWQRKLNF